METKHYIVLMSLGVCALICFYESVSLHKEKAGKLYWANIIMSAVVLSLMMYYSAIHFTD